MKSNRNKAVAELLRKARARIENPRRWRKGAMGSDAAYTRKSAQETCKVCALGAIAWADTGSPWGERSEVGRQATEVLKQVVRPRYSGVIGFNDNSATKHADVLAAFDEAIRLAEGKKPRAIAA